MNTHNDSDYRIGRSVSFDQEVFDLIEKAMPFSGVQYDNRSRFVNRACKEMAERLIAGKARAASPALKDILLRDLTPGVRSTKSKKNAPKVTKKKSAKTPKIVKTPKIANSTAKVTHSDAPASPLVQQS